MAPFQVAIDKHSWELLPTAARVFTFIYPLIAVAHILILADELVSSMVSIAAFSLVVGISLLFLLKTK
jgi:hypothetical protein